MPLLALTVVAAAYSIGVFAWADAHTVAAGSNLAFYLLLIVNTYFSLLFTETTYRVRDTLDVALSIVLGACYLLLPWLVGDSVRFHCCLALFFGVAAIKYTSWLRLLDARFFLRRKITVNTCGAMLSAIVVSGIAMSGQRYSMEITVAALGIYAIANVWVLIVDPLYRDQ